MRIERINENSIRCTLSSFDLSVRNLNLRELAYGSEKAKKLFEEMMAKARSEVGFHVDNTPLMIEAIPMSGDSIQLIISKVPDPEELDTRFSRFTKNPEFKSEAENWLGRLTSAILEGAGTLAEQLKADVPGGSILKADIETIKNAEAKKHPLPGKAASDGTQAAGAHTDSGAADTGAPSPEAAGSTPREPVYRAFTFDELNLVISTCAVAAPYDGASRLYKSPEGKYILVIESNASKEEDFHKVCNIAAEYGRMIRTVRNSLSYYEEHFRILVRENVINSLSKI